jgi:hypothetical protein
MVQRSGRIGSRSMMTFSARAAIFVRSVLVAASLIALFVLLVSRASAQGAYSQAKQACKADYSRFCAGLAPGGGRIRKCLGDHHAELAPACRQALDANPPK